MWPSVQFVERVFLQVIRLATLTLKQRGSGNLTFKGLKLLLEELKKELMYVLVACVQAGFKEPYSRVINVKKEKVENI